MIRNVFLTIALLFITQTAMWAQVAWLEPEDATVDSTVTVYFDATAGNQGLMGYAGDVYAHTGVLTLQSANENDWKHVVADWGIADERVRMQQEAENLYSITFTIRDFYGIGPNETVLNLAFVFRNADGSVAGRCEDGSDIIIPLQTQSRWNYSSFTNNSQGLKIHTTGGDLAFRPYGDAMIRAEIVPEDAATDSSYAIVKKPEAGTFTVDTSATAIHASWEDMEVRVSKSPLKVHFFKGDTLIALKSFFSGEAEGGLLTFKLNPDTHVYGGGSRALPFDLRGHKIEFYNQAHYGYANNTPNLNTSIPILATSAHYALLFDNHHYSTATIAGDSPALEYKANQGPLRFFLIAGENMENLSAGISDLTGHAPMPPQWALGYIQSKYGYETREEAESVVADMQANGFSMDALILDLYWFGGTQQMGSFNWDTGRFPDPKGMMDDFAAQGIKTILITEPYFTLESDLYSEAASKGHFAKNAEGDPYVLYGFWAGDASLLDMTSPDARNWLWPHYRNLLDMGADGLWTDLAEPETHPREMMHEKGAAREVHNLYNNLWSSMIHTNFRNDYPNRRLFNLTRSGYTGMQRYSTYPWSGDIQRSFNGLQAQIPIMLHMSMSGVGYMHSDLGGFTGGGQNGELYTRWMQLGTFSPVMRAHGTGVPPEPIFYNETTQDNVRKAIAMRYKFLPHNYTLAWQYSKNGIPPARPMNYYSDHAALQAVNDQFFWGKDLLVAPVLSEGATSRTVTLPPGKWANYTNGTVHEGPGTIRADAPLADIPLFIRQGGFLVQSAKNLPNTGAYNSDSITIRHLTPADGQSTSRPWYHDDGKTFANHKENRYDLMHLSSSTRGDVSTITLEQTENNINSPERYIRFIIYGLGDVPGEIRINGKAYTFLTKDASKTASAPDIAWDGTFLRVGFQWKDNLTQITIDGSSPSHVESSTAGQRLQVHASPNPFNENTSIQVITRQAGSCTFTLHTPGGRKISSHNTALKAGRQRLGLKEIAGSTSLLPAGMYLLSVKCNGQYAHTRLVKTATH